MSTVVLHCWCHSDSASVLLYFTFLSHLFPLPCGALYNVYNEGYSLLFTNKNHLVYLRIECLFSASPKFISRERRKIRRSFLIFKLSSNKKNFILKAPDKENEILLTYFVIF